MKILYHNPTCGSGIEQVGYTFLLILKKLGHEIDFYNTQCANLQENVIGPSVGNYDMVILNSAYDLSFSRMIKKERNNVWNICHDGSALPSFCKQLSLNYMHQSQLFCSLKTPNISFPLTYPYNFRDEEFNEDRPNRFVFVGRWISDKFVPEVKNAMEQSNIKIDKAFINSISPEYDCMSVVKEKKSNAGINEVFDYLKTARFLLLPSTTECISLVAGEALVNGCIPVVLETEMREHAQFYNCIVAYSPKEFADIVIHLNKTDRDPTVINRKRIFNFSRKMWSLDKSIEEMRSHFGTGNSGKINVLYNEYKDMDSVLSYANAKIITGESL